MYFDAYSDGHNNCTKFVLIDVVLGSLGKLPTYLSLPTYLLTQSVTYDIILIATLFLKRERSHKSFNFLPFYFLSLVPCNEYFFSIFVSKYLKHKPVIFAAKNPFIHKDSR